MKIVSLFLICSFFFLSPFFLASKAIYHREGLITLTFDDGYGCHYDAVLPLLEKYGMRATFYVNTGTLDEKGYLTTEQVIQLAQRKHQIASHGITHRNLKQLSKNEIEKELLGSKLALENLIQHPVMDFAPPYGATNFTTTHCIRKYYQSSRGIVPGLNPIKSLNPYLIRAYVVFNFTSLKEFESWLDRAISENKWLVIVYHLIDTNDTLLSISDTTFDSQLDAIYRRGMRTAPMEDALRH